MNKLQTYTYKYDYLRIILNRSGRRWRDLESNLFLYNKDKSQEIHNKVKTASQGLLRYEMGYERC